MYRQWSCWAESCDQAAKLGKKVAVIEKQQCIGEVCIETGTIPSKMFREAIYQIAKAGVPLTDTFAYTPRVRPTMSQLVGHVGQVMQREINRVHDVLTRNRVELIHGRVSFVDACTLRVESLEGQRTMTTDHILIAVGTRPSEPRGIAPDGKTVLTPDHVLSIEELPHTMVVVGASVIGIEYASMFAALGGQVTVVDQRPRTLEFLDYEIVDELIHQMRKHLSLKGLPASPQASILLLTRFSFRPVG